MTLDSRVQFGERLQDHLSQESQNILLDLRYLPWNGKELPRGERFVVQWNDHGKMALATPTAWWVDDALAKAYAVVKTHFERDGEKIKHVTFIQERKPQVYQVDEHDRDISNSGAGTWHNHLRESPKNAVVVLDEVGGTDFIEGEIEVTDEAKVTQQEVSEALKNGKAEKKRLPAGTVGRFTGKTVHKRGDFESAEPRLVIVVEFED